jgi:hypothetical protein
MRLNGGLVGRVNNPTRYKGASGIWSWREQQQARYENNFPRWVLPFDLTYLKNNTIEKKAYFSVGAQEATLRGMAFSSDGTKMYAIGTTADTVKLYNLSIAWDINTAVYAGTGFDFSVVGVEANPASVIFSTDGTKMYITGITTDNVLEYDLGTAWLPHTAVYNNKFLYIGNQEGVAYGSYIKPDGTKYYTIGSTNDILIEYTLSTPWDISTGVYTTSLAPNPFISNPAYVIFTPDGYTFYIGGSLIHFDIQQYNLTVAWDLTTATLAKRAKWQAMSNSALYQTTSPVFSADGNYLYFVDTNIDNIMQLSLSAPYKIIDDGFTSEGTWNADDFGELKTNQFMDFTFDNTGTIMFMPNKTTSILKRYDLSIPWDTSTAIYNGDYIDLTGLDANTNTSFYGFTMKSDGTKFYILNSFGSQGYLWAFDLNTPWVLSSAVGYDSSTGKLSTGIVGGVSGPYCTSVQINLTYGYNIVFSNDGTKFFILYAPSGGTTRQLRQYHLSTAWDITTFSYSGAYLNYLAYSPSFNPGAPMAFNLDGTKIYVYNNANYVYNIANESLRQLYVFELNDAFNLASTVTLVDQLSIGLGAHQRTGLVIADDGSKLLALNLETVDKGYYISEHNLG